MQVTLLGTGTPVPDLVRRGPSQVIEVGPGLLLVDCGRGATDRFVEAGFVQPGGRRLRLPLHTIALTHLHSDHVTGLPDLLWAGWVMHWWEQPPTLVGPPGTAALLQHLMAAFADDIAVRERSEATSRAELIPRVLEVAEGWSTTGAAWQVQSFRVEHPPLDEAFGYRIEGDGGTVVISGDSRYSENLIRHAHGANVLIHEVYSRYGIEQRRQATLADPRQQQRLQTIVGHHTASDEVGLVAAQAEAEQLVLTHVNLGFGGSVADITADVANAYARPFSVGADLQTFAV